MLSICSKMMSLETGWILLCLVSISSGYEICYEYNSFKTKTLTCTYSCCGSSTYRYCCGGPNTSVGAIIGIVVGVIVLIALVVGIIVCCVCCCKSSPGHRGQVVTSGQQLTVISTGPNAVSGAYNAGYVHTVQSPPPPGTFIQSPVAMTQPPPPYSPPIGPGHPPGPGPGHPPGLAHPPMQGQTHLPMQSPAHPPGPAHPKMPGPANPLGQSHPPMQGPRPPPAGSRAPQMGDTSGRTKTDDEHVYTSLQF